MSGHHHEIDDNNAAMDALQATAFVAVPFLIAVFAGLILISGVPFFGGDAGHDTTHAVEAAH